MALTMERVCEADMQFVVEVYNSIISGGEITADTEFVTVEDWMPWLAKHQKDARPAWILHNNGDRCGWMSFSDYYDRPAYDITVEVSIYLHDSFRGQGLGRQFLTMGMEYIGRQGIRNVLAFIFSDNAASMHLFEKLGFVCWGVLPKACLINDTEKDVSILGLRL